MSLTDVAQIIVLSGCAVAAMFITALGIKGWRNDRYLCTDCKYNGPAMCNKAERPRAIDCIAYVSKEETKP